MTPEPSPPPRSESDDALLARTRSGVVNLLMLTGVGIAASGGLLRIRDRFPRVHAPESVRRALLGILITLAVSSYLARRFASRPAGPGRRLDFHRGHVLAAGLASLAVPLGLAYAWVDRPRLESIAPFWLAALGLGVLAFPRSYELASDPAPEAGGPRP